MKKEHEVYHDKPELFLEYHDEDDEEVNNQWLHWRENQHMFSQSTNNDYLTQKELKRALKVKDKLVLHQFTR
jgi:hypothetical protein